MDSYTIDYVEVLSKDIEERMESDLIAYERGHGIDLNYKKFFLVVKDVESRVFGVLNAYTAFSEIYIDAFWVEKKFRGKGYGKKMVEALENQFKGKGYNNINLVTSSFQAPEFYKKCGFSVEFERKNLKNPKLSKTFFIKYFDDEIQTQGIWKE